MHEDNLPITIARWDFARRMKKALAAARSSIAAFAKAPELQLLPESESKHERDRIARALAAFDHLAEDVRPAVDLNTFYHEPEDAWLDQASRALDDDDIAQILLPELYHTDRARSLAAVRARRARLERRGPA